MGGSARYFGCAVGFGFGVLWMTEGLGAAIVCLLLAALGYGAVSVAERAQANASTGSAANETAEVEALHTPPDGFELDHGRYYEPRDDATTPLTAEAEYGWPVSHGEEDAEADHAPLTSERT